MVSKLISVKQVIAKVMSDLDIKEDSQRMSDYIEWASEAVEKIGSVAQLDGKVSGVDGEPYLEPIVTGKQIGRASCRERV